MDYLDISYIRDTRTGRYARVPKVLTHSMSPSAIHVLARSIIHTYMLGALGKEKNCMFVYKYKIGQSWCMSLSQFHANIEENKMPVVNEC